MTDIELKYKKANDLLSIMEENISCHIKNKDRLNDDEFSSLLLIYAFLNTAYNTGQIK